MPICYDTSPFMDPAPNPLEEIGLVHTASVQESLASFPSMEEFLHVDVSFGIHSTTVPYPEFKFKYELDLDRVCMELRELDGIKAGLHYLLLPRRRVTWILSSWTSAKSC